MNTVFPSGNEIKRNWFVLDAGDQVLGRVASKAAMILMGKHKPGYAPFLDTGDHVVVINASKIRLTGRKEQQKVYRSHSGYPGGLREVSVAVMRAKRPAKIVEEAVAGMLPKTKLGKHMLKKLKVYAGERHPHQAQKPVEIAAVK
ncbi:MAG TPA: 50S ribosomal protein L13 [Bryobacteraceae bacterium]|nr:50S ribosomal protein L13 [Bryobacteraceae bacterium]